MRGYIYGPYQIYPAASDLFPVPARRRNLGISEPVLLAVYGGHNSKSRPPSYAGFWEGRCRLPTSVRSPSGGWWAVPPTSVQAGGWCDDGRWVGRGRRWVGGRGWAMTCGGGRQMYRSSFRCLSPTVGWARLCSARAEWPVECPLTAGCQLSGTKQTSKPPIQSHQYNTGMGHPPRLCLHLFILSFLSPSNAGCIL